MCSSRKLSAEQVGCPDSLRYQPRPNFYVDVPGICRYEFLREIFGSRAQLKPDQFPDAYCRKCISRRTG